MKKYLKFFLVSCLTIFLFFIANVEAKEINLFSENFIKSNIAEDSKFEAVIRFKSEYKFNSKNASVKKVRNTNKEHFDKFNKLLVDLLGVSNLDISYSSYSPFAFVRFNSYNSYIKKRNVLNNICENDSVESVTIESMDFDNKEEVNETSTYSSTSYVSFSNMKQMVGITSSSPSYTGNGVKVGVIDEGNPGYLYLKNNKVIESNCSNYEDLNSNHTSKVLSILYGIAPNIDVYLTSFSTDNTGEVTSLKDNVEWLLGKNVNIINMSFRDLSSVGIYNGYCAYLDYIIANNNVLFVKSAGNNAEYVTSPGGGMNVLTVGSVDSDYSVSSFSAYGMTSTYNLKIMKPNLVAPGRLVIPIINSATTTVSKNGYGTSFSAPIVSALAALLMEEDASLSNNVCKLITLLMSGAIKLPSQTTITQSNCGVGIVNYNYTRNTLLCGRIITTTNNQDMSGEMIEDFSFQVNELTSQLTMMTMTPIEFSYSYNYDIYGNLIDSEGNNPQIVNKTRYSLDIYDSDYNKVVSFTSSSNFILKELNFESGTYICEIIMNTTRPSNETDKITIIIE